MVIMFLKYRGETIALMGSMAEIMAQLRAWCPNGKVVEIFATAGGLQ